MSDTISTARDLAAMIGESVGLVWGVFEEWSKLSGGEGRVWVTKSNEIARLHNQSRRVRGSDGGDERSVEAMI